MAFEINYSIFDRIVHRIAFATPAVQLTAADIESTLYNSKLKELEVRRPIFVTSLPRAGTTLMLEVLARFPSLACHTYRDMPFVMAPLLWSKVTSAFHKQSRLRERAHADGMQVGYDSPEAFEEVIWKAFWPEKYTNTGISLWTASDNKDAARDFFIEHIKKIMLLRLSDNIEKGCYISKNNANIARLDFLHNLFPDVSILVPVRHPVEHAFSMYRQHCNFKEMHKKEPFVLRYMADIGHFEFGDLHRPIAFPELDELTADRRPLDPDYWLAYWISAFEYVRSRRDRVMIISYDAACADGRKALKEICARFKIPENGMLDAAASLFRDSSGRKSDEAKFDVKLRERAEAIYQDLVSC